MLLILLLISGDGAEDIINKFRPFYELIVHEVDAFEYVADMVVCGIMVLSSWFIIHTISAIFSSEMPDNTSTLQIHTLGIR